MADNHDEYGTQNISATFPNPPNIIWHAFTAENVERMEKLRIEHVEKLGLNGAAEITSRLPDVPPELIFLQPPAEPSDGKWRVFGEEMNLREELQSLEDAGVQRLVPPLAPGYDGGHADRAFELKRLAKSLLLNFIELAGILSIRPNHVNLAEAKINDINTIMLNFHHVLNEYRPHQARESLIALMQKQLDDKRAETAAIREVVDKAKKVLEGLASIEVPAGVNGDHQDAQQGTKAVLTTAERQDLTLREYARARYC